jgi:E3 ubiquitin-protein ligase TRIP12
MGTSLRTFKRTAVLSYRNVKLEDLCLDFTLPGSPEYELIPGGSQKMVTLDSLEEYVSLVVNATLNSGIGKQIEAFKSGINEVCFSWNRAKLNSLLCIQEVLT